MSDKLTWAKFMLRWSDGTETAVVGYGISDACKRANLDTADKLQSLDSYDGPCGTVQVAGASKNCGCSYHAEQGLSCPHDIATAGIFARKTCAV